MAFVRSLTPGGSTAASTAFHVDSYAAVGNGTSDDSAAFQAAVNAAAAAATAFSTRTAAIVQTGRKHYRASGLTLPGNVAVVGDGTRITANASGPIFTLNGNYNRLQSLYLAGNGNGTGASGITVATSSRWNTLQNLTFDAFNGRAVYDQAIATWASNLHAQNCLLGADSLSVYTGVYEAAGTDAWITNCEFTASRYPANGMSASGKACAFAIYGANTMASQVVAETSDHGVYLGSGATQLRLNGVRGELCYGHGWLIEGGSGRISDPMALRNSQAADITYDGFRVTNTGATNFVIVNAWSESAASPAKQNFGYGDLNVSLSSFNRWINPVDVGSNVGFFAANSTGTVYQFGDNPPFNLPSGTTPGVSGRTTFLGVAGSAVSVTNFLQGVNGQRLLLRGDGNTTLVHGATISNTSGANLLLASNTWYRYVRIAGVWTQLP